MRSVIFAIVLLMMAPLISIDAQGIGEIAPEKPPEVFPDHAWGLDIMIGESGFGLGTFFRNQLSMKWTVFADLSLSETKDDREFEYVDFFGRTFTIGKKIVCLQFLSM
jgi:hypothetical protein